MKVLVSGLNGFTGRFVQRELEAQGHQVVGLKARLLDRVGIEHEVRQINPEAVIHLAAVAFVAHGNADDFYNANLIGTRNLLAGLSCCEVLPKCVLLTSSANVYGNTDAEVIDELTPPRPANDYGVSKLAMEYMAKTWLERLPIVITRPFNYTGQGQSEQFLLPKIVSHYRCRAESIELGNLNVERDFLDVRVVARCYRQLIETPPPPGEILNVCSGHAVSLSEVLEVVENLTDHKMKIIVNPSFVRANEVRRLCGSRLRLENFIGPVENIRLKDTLYWMLSGDSLSN